jgi:hypothetical protein
LEGAKQKVIFVEVTMNRLFACILAACMIASAPLALCAGEVGSVSGNSPLVAQPVSYTVFALPANYQSDPVSQDLIRGFNGENSDLVNLRNSTKFVCYTADDPDFKARFAGVMPEVSQQGKPGVLVTYGSQKMYCNYGVNSTQVARELRADKVVEKMCPQCRPHHPKPDEPKPTVTPEQPPAPMTPITPTVAPAPPAPVEQANLGQVALGICACMALVWFLFFRVRMM